MIPRALELKPTNKNQKFKDVTWFSNEVQALYEAGIVKGFTDGTFGESKPLSRQQTAAMIASILKYVDVDTIPKENIEMEDMDRILATMPNQLCNTLLNMMY